MILNEERPRMAAGLTWGFAVSGGIALANLYWAQRIFYRYSIGKQILIYAQ